MATHNLVRRQPHAAVGKKRFQPARLPNFPALELDNDSKPVVPKAPDGVARRQFPGFTGLPDLTDLFPPVIPTNPPDETDTTPPVLPTTPTPTKPPVNTNTGTTTTTPGESTPAETPTSPTTTSPTTTSPTTTQTTPRPAAPTTPPPVVVTELDSETVVVTSSLTRSTSTTSSASDAASTTLLSQDDDAGSETGPIIGAFVAGVIALAVLVVTIVWFIRRRRRNEADDLQTFNPHDFRRSAVLINDNSPGYGAASAGGLSRGYSFNSNGHTSEGMSYSDRATPRPPTMIERKLAQTPANNYEGHGYPSYPATSSHGHGDVYGNGYGAEPGANGNPYGYNHYVGYQNHQHFSGPPFQSYMPQPPLQPGQVVDPNAYANPFANPAAGYQEQSPFSPSPSQETERYSETYDSSGVSANNSGSPAVLAQVGGAAVLTRSISTRSARSGKSAQLSISIPKNTPVNATVIAEASANDIDARRMSKVDYPTTLNSESSVSMYSAVSTLKRKQSASRAPAHLPIRESAELPTSDYVDLSRSSVSPFQAAQYAEISKRLNADIPQGLSGAQVEQTVRDRDLPDLPPPSPHNAPPSHGVTSPPTLPMEAHTRDSYASDASGQQLPGRPTERIVSLPPQLPEINIDHDHSPTTSSQDHAHAVGSYFRTGTLGVTGEKNSPIYPSGITAGGSPLLGRFPGTPSFPVTPSPLGTSFGLDTPKTGEISGAAVRSDQGIFMRLQQEEEEKMKRRAERAKGKEQEEKKPRPPTVYDEADAYGGF